MVSTNMLKYSHRPVKEASLAVDDGRV